MNYLSDLHSFLLAAVAYLSLLLFPLLEPLYRMLGFGGGDCMGTLVCAFMFWIWLSLAAGLLALIAIVRRRGNVWHVLALLGALFPLFLFIKECPLFS